MKLSYILFGLVLLGLVGGSFYYTNMRHDDMNVTVATSTQMTESIYVYKEYGDISFKNKTASTYTQVSDKKMLIANYSSVKTGDGRGYVIFPDNSSITLSSSTEIEISYEPTKTSIMQLLGSTYHRVTSLATGNKYEVRTPNTLAAVRGTKLAVTYNPKTKKTFVAVTEHTIEVTQTKEDGSIAKAPVLIQEGNLAEVQSSTSTAQTSSTQLGGSVTVRKNDEVNDIKILIEENKPLDKEYDKTPLEERKQLMEKIIDSLQKESSTTKSTNEGAETKPETRTETVIRVIKQVDTTTRSVEKTLPTTVKEEIKVVTPLQSEVAATKVSEVVSTRKLIIFTASEDPSKEEETFVNSFYTMYERLYLVDDAQVYCKNIGNKSAKEMLASLLTITNQAGYILPDQTELLSFGTDLTNACADGSISNKSSSFKTRFDTAYPY